MNSLNVKMILQQNIKRRINCFKTYFSVIFREAQILPETWFVSGLRFLCQPQLQTHFKENLLVFASDELANEHVY